MDKKTQMYVGVGVLALAGYMFYTNWKKKQVKAPSTAATDAPATAAAPASFDGAVAGKRVKMVGMAGENQVIASSSWIKNAGGDSKMIAPDFFNVKDGSWGK